jgi:peptidoglycan hydrolase CwlO-like protein
MKTGNYILIKKIVVAISIAAILIVCLNTFINISNSNKEHTYNIYQKKDSLLKDSISILNIKIDSLSCSISKIKSKNEVLINKIDLINRKYDSIKNILRSASDDKLDSIIFSNYVHP